MKQGKSVIYYGELAKLLYFENLKIWKLAKSKLIKSWQVQQTK